MEALSLGFGIPSLSLSSFAENSLPKFKFFEGFDTWFLEDGMGCSEKTSDPVNKN